MLLWVDLSVVVEAVPTEGGRRPTGVGVRRSPEIRAACDVSLRPSFRDPLTLGEDGLFVGIIRRIKFIGRSMSESEQFVAQRGRTWTDVNKFLLENLRRTVSGVQKESGHYRVTAPTSRRADRNNRPTGRRSSRGTRVRGRGRCGRC